MFQAAIALVALISVFIVFRSEAIDRYVDNRKSNLKTYLGDRFLSEIQNYGKGCDENDNVIAIKISELLDDSKRLGAQISCNEILQYYLMKKRIIKKGVCVVFMWAITASFYLFAHVSDMYLHKDEKCGLYYLVMMAFLIPLLISVFFSKWALEGRRGDKSKKIPRSTCMTIEASDFLRWYSDEVNRYRNLEWQLAGYSIAISYGSIYLFASKVDMFKSYMFAFLLVIAVAAVSFALAQSHAHRRLNHYRSRRETLVNDPTANHLVAESPLFIKESRDTVFLLGFLIFPVGIAACAFGGVIALGT